MTSPLARGLIVSCQAEGDSPFNSPEFIAAFAQAAEQGGAVGVRICSPPNLRAVRQVTALPIMGLSKGNYPNGDVLITPTLADAEALIGAGADFIALDATQRPRPQGLLGTEMVRLCKQAFPAIPLLADIATLEEGLAAAAAGADYVATTLAGYTPETRGRYGPGPALDLVAQLAAQLSVPVIAEGRIRTPQEASQALTAGAWAVVVGTAITRPIALVESFVAALPANSTP
ncbi:MAG: N-acetylmannosamine-6-phosphate 2-epimerase [Gloeomargaritaceae cyanobacterium C42_A2020_066]|nr:N-acetylmannosamine-6-phosphate 2-epimerase [Gloeomargaritaceae cyanobacterium C42_A2020_066]